MSVVNRQPVQFGTMLVAMLVVWLSGAPFVVAVETPSRLGITAIDSDKPYFDVQLEPGESAELTVQFSNFGEHGADALVYAMNVHTIPGGGLGLAGLDDLRMDPVTWIDLPTETLALLPGEHVSRTFTVTVPEGTGPGDYIAAIGIQNAEPDAVAGNESGQRFTQTVRHGVAVAIDVPGPREPALDLGDVSYTSSSGRSVIQANLLNTGNTHLKPAGEFTLFDSKGVVVAHRALAFDTVYAGTEMPLDVALDDDLAPGQYTVTVHLGDDAAALTAVDHQATITIEPSPTEPITPAGQNDADPGIAGMISGDDGRVPGTLFWIAGGIALVATGVLTVLFFLRRVSHRARSHRHLVPLSAPLRARESRKPRQLRPQKPSRNQFRTSS